MLSHVLHLSQKVTGNEDHVPSAGVEAKEVAQPLNRLRVEAIRGLIEHEHLGIRQDRPRQSQALAHSEREGLGTLLGLRGQSDQVKHLVDPRVRNVRLCTEHAQMCSRCAIRIEEAGIEVCAHDLGRVRVVRQTTTVPLGLPFASVQTKHEAHRGGFPRPVRA